jgi:hypothetical protein
MELPMVPVRQSWSSQYGKYIVVALALPIALALVLFGVACPSVSLAAESGTTHYLPGGAATLIDLAPTKPGWVAESIYLHYEADASANLPVAGLISLGLDATSDALLVGGFYTLPQRVVGARYTLGVFLPYIWIEAEASVSGPLGRSLSRKDSTSGIGDMTLIPVMMAWKSNFLQFNAMLPIYVPTGDYDTGRLANPGLNYWTFDPTVGVSYNNDKIGLNAAGYLGISFNTENPDTDYQSGSMLHLDGSVQQLLPVGPGFLGVGAEAFYLQQIDGDSGSGARLGDFKGRTAGIGPVLTYILPYDKATFVAEVRWLPELDVKRRLDGDYIWVKLIAQF